MMSGWHGKQNHQMHQFMQGDMMHSLVVHGKA